MRSPTDTEKKTKTVNRQLSNHTWGFYSEGEADLAVAMWNIASRQGMDINEFKYIYGGTLRMLGVADSVWSELKQP